MNINSHKIHVDTLINGIKYNLAINMVFITNYTSQNTINILSKLSSIFSKNLMEGKDGRIVFSSLYYKCIEYEIKRKNQNN